MRDFIVSHIHGQQKAKQHYSFTRNVSRKYIYFGEHLYVTQMQTICVTFRKL